jgi:hydroxymethylpyrimidine/phosphomethylpyrimidine kinase
MSSVAGSHELASEMLHLHAKHIVVPTEDSRAARHLLDVKAGGCQHGSRVYLNFPTRAKKKAHGYGCEFSSAHFRVPLMHE